MKINILCGGQALRIALGITMLALLLASSASAVDVNACTTISSRGEYVLKTDLSSSSTCITITSNNVFFDGASHTISGGDKGNYGTYGINVSSGTTNVTVKNLTVTNWYLGIYYLNVRNGNVLNNKASNNTYGIYLHSSNNNTLITNTANHN